MRDEIILDDAQRKAVQKHALAALCEFDRLCKSHHINYMLAYGTLIGAIRHKGFIPWDDDIDVCVTRNELMKLRSIANKELKRGFYYQTQSTDNSWFRLYDKIRVDGTVFREIAHENEKIHQGVYIDIFPIDNIPSSPFLSKCQLYLYKLSSYILSAKYISLRQRQGLNKCVAFFLMLIFYPIKKKWLYDISEKIASYFPKGKLVRNFESPYDEVFDKSIYSDYIDIDFEGHKFTAISLYDYWLKAVYGDYMKLPPVEKRITRHAISDIRI